jgi:hypothetical protein
MMVERCVPEVEMRVLQIFLIVVAMDSTVSKTTDSGVHWIFLHYHKTGAVLSEKIATAIALNRFSLLDDKNKRKDFLIGESADIILSHGGNFLFNWTQTLSKPNLLYRVVHLVRDPYDMVISGLLYHSQSPPPEGIRFSRYLI